MSIAGNYGFVYSGAIGVGIGAFVIRGEQVRGRDMMHGTYKGSVAANAHGSLQLVLAFTTPADVGLATGAAAQEVETTRPIVLTLPPLFGDGEAFKAELQFGPANVMIRRMPDVLDPDIIYGPLTELLDLIEKEQW